MGARSQSDAQDLAPWVQSRQNITFGVFMVFVFVVTPFMFFL